MSSPTHDVAELYRLYAGMVQRRALRVLGNKADAEEVTQEVFRVVLENLKSFRGDASWTTWLYRVSTRASIRLLKKERRRTALRQLFLQPTDDPQPHTADETLVLRRILSRVPTDVGLAAIHYYVDGMSHDEIAELMQCSRRKIGYLIEHFHARSERIMGAQTMRWSNQ